MNFQSPQNEPAPPTFPTQGFEPWDQAPAWNAAPDFGNMPTYVVGGRPKQSWWERVGGGSLMVSLLVHGAFVLIAIFLITLAVIANKKAEEPVDFLPGGGGGGPSNASQQAAKRKTVTMTQPKSRITSSVSSSTIVLPESPMIQSQVSLSALVAPRAGGTGNGQNGLQGTGQGGLRGNGFGPGHGAGNMAGFVAMFGRRLAANKLGVVLDVSRSMHPFLPAVVKEANKVGVGAPIVMAYGCGAAEPKTKNMRASRAKIDAAKGKDFDSFWHRIPVGAAPDKSMDVDLTKPMPLKETYDVVNGRKDTFYMEKLGVENCWAALVSEELRTVDAVYWFADFKDPMDEETLKDLLRELQKRKQKLYVHASGDGAKFLPVILEKVVRPSGGEEIKANLTPTAPTAPAKPAKPAKAAIAA